jgi:hypothetical protein
MKFIKRFVYVCVCVYIYIYIYRERERERERQKGRTYSRRIGESYKSWEKSDTFYYGAGEGKFCLKAPRLHPFVLLEVKFGSGGLRQEQQNLDFFN